jgi:isoleucyl-tRNA synthetase
MKEQLEKMETLIKAEVNVKELEYITATQGVISKKIKANFKTLGAKLGASMKEAAAAIAGFTQDKIAALEMCWFNSACTVLQDEFTIDMLRCRHYC